MKIMLQICFKFLLICTFIGLSYSCPTNVTSVKFNQTFGTHWGEVVISEDGNAVNLSLRNQTGSTGFASRGSYASGLFSAYIKFPPQNYSGGIVVTFYLTNGDKYPDNQHDEIDFEFLGHNNNQEWIIQTNVYGNGSMARGREERYTLWFDPGQEAHKYSIYWDSNRILFYVDDLIIRKVIRVDKMGADYPSKPMSLFSTIWDGSDWATDGGRAKANFTHEPFVAQYSNFTLNGCRFNPTRNVSYCGGSGPWTVCGNMTAEQLSKYEETRKEFLTYSYCEDKARYNTTLPECLDNPGNGRPV